MIYLTKSNFLAIILSLVSNKSYNYIVRAACAARTSELSSTNALFSTQASRTNHWSGQNPALRERALYTRNPPLNSGVLQNNKGGR